MHRFLSVLIVFVILLGLLAGCQQETADERKLSVFELTLSDEIKEEAKAAYIQWYKNTYGQEPGVQWVWEDTTSGEINTYSNHCRYYGTFDGCVIWFWPEDSAALDVPNYSGISGFELADSHFGYGAASDFHVLKDGAYYPLKLAYNQKLISAEDISIVAERHRACREDFRSYGSYGNWTVWLVDNDKGQWIELEVANSVFNCTEGSVFYVSGPKANCTLQQAYKRGYLKAEDVAAVAEAHNATEPWAFLPTPSDEIKAKIEEANTKYHQEQEPNYVSPGMDWYYVSHGGLVGCLYYLGTFGDCVAWVSVSNADAITEFTLADSYFYCSTYCLFKIYREGNIYALQDAYEQSFLTAEDIAVIAERHEEFKNGKPWRE